MYEKRNYKDPQYVRLRKEVYRRDKFTCQMPNCGSKKRLNCHHIRCWASNPTLRFISTNCITLCSTCHKRVTGQEQDFEQLFTNIVNSKTKRNSEVARFRYTGRSHKDII